MRQSSNPPAPYRIQAVAELTGVPEPTLRAWERRYGIPVPQRTASGYRLYGHRDVEQVREMRRLCNEGLAAAEAARTVLARTNGAAQSDIVPADGGSPADDPFVTVVQRILQAVEDFDDLALDDELRRLFFLGPAVVLIERAITPALVEIGNRWHAGELSVAQEHLASQRLGAMLRDLLRLGTSGEDGPRVICGCFAEEQHELGVLACAVRFAGMGLRPVYLGARTPPSAIRSAVVASEARLVALSITLAPERSEVRALLEDYVAACAGVPLIIGGGGAGTLRDLIVAAGALAAPENPAELRAVVRMALDSPRAARVRTVPRRRRGRS